MSWHKQSGMVMLEVLDAVMACVETGAIRANAVSGLKEDEAGREP